MKASCWVSDFRVLLHFIVEIFLHCIMWTQARKIILSSLTIPPFVLGGWRKQCFFIISAHTGVKWVCCLKESFCFCQAARQDYRSRPSTSPLGSRALTLTRRVVADVNCEQMYRGINYWPSRLLSPTKPFHGWQSRAFLAIIPLLSFAGESASY